MNWHYVNQGQQAGPISEGELLMLVREGKISGETLVWREGMQNWTPFHQAGIPASPAPVQPPPFRPPTPVNPNEAACAECGKIFPIDETIAYGNLRVCATCKPVFLQKLAEGAKIKSVGGLNLDYAGFWIRFGAKILDNLIVSIPIVILWVVLIAVIGAASNHSQSQDATDMMAGLILIFLFFGSWIIFIGYEVYFVAKYGATPGKMACKLKIVLADGSHVGWGRATGRAFAKMLSRMVFFIGYLMVAFDKEQKRALHDHMCSTRVVHR